MIRLGLRLSLSGGRQAISRLVLIALAVSLGIGMLLTTLAGIHAVGEQNGRYAWLETGFVPDPPHAAAGIDPMWWRVTGDTYDTRTIGRVDVARTGPNPPKAPGIAQLPAAGEYYASPAMVALLHDVPADELGDRYPGRLAGTIGAEGLPAPDSLLIVVGHTVADEQRYSDAQLVHAISAVAPDDCGSCPVGIGVNANGIDLILAVVTGALVFPVLVFIGVSTRLSAARRERRFAALRLLGATPRQITALAAIEAAIAAVVGTALGFVLFYALRSQVARIPFTGERFFTDDLAVGRVTIVATALGAPLVAALAARLALRRVHISPLGVTRQVTPAPPSAWRLLVVAAGVAELGFFFVHGSPSSSEEQVAAYLSGILIIMAGLVVAGPWLTMIATRVVARRTASPTALVAGRRLADNPQAGFRAISGLVLALFVGTVATAVVAAFTHERDRSDQQAVRPVLVKSLLDFSPTGVPRPSVPAVPAGVLHALRATHGVTVVVLGHANDAGPWDTGLVVCADLARLTGKGRCAPGAQVAQVDSSFVYGPTSASIVWPTAAQTPATVRSLPVMAVVIGTDGTTAAAERARTVLDVQLPVGQSPSTDADLRSDRSRLSDQYRQLADVVILASLPIAGASLAVSVVGGLSDRRRPFGLLRLSGVPLAMLRRVVALESIVPLLAGALAAIGSGFVVAQLFLQAQLGYSVVAPDLTYYLVVGVGLVASIAIVASTLPLLDRATDLEAVRDG